MRARIAGIILWMSLYPLLSPAYAQGEQRQDILQFMKFTHVEEGLHDSIKFYRDELHKNYPELPASFYKDLDVDLNNYVRDMERYYIKLYSQRFTESDMRTILSFLATPVGMKFSKANKELVPDIARYASTKMKKIDQKVEDKLKNVKPAK